MATEFTANIVSTVQKTTAQIVCLGLFLLIVALLARLASLFLPDKYRDGKIAPPITEQPTYVKKLEKEMEEAGVDNLCDLEEYRENKREET